MEVEACPMCDSDAIDFSVLPDKYGYAKFHCMDCNANFPVLVIKQSNLTGHVKWKWKFSNVEERKAYISLTLDDIGFTAWQVDTNTIWTLEKIDVTIVWTTKEILHTQIGDEEYLIDVRRVG